MSESLYASRVRQCESRLKSQRSKFETATKKVAKLEGEARQLEKQLRGKKPGSSHDSLVRRLERKRDDLSKAKEAASKLAIDVSTAETKLSEARGKLADARAAAERKRENKEESDRKKRERKEAAEDLRRRQQERERVRSTEDRLAREAHRVDVLDARTGELEVRTAEAERRAAPPEITVLFLGSSPVDQSTLRLDQETREIQKRIRATDYRDSIWVEWRLARQMTDLIDDLNEVRPTVLHFSGHSDEEALVFEGDDGLTQELTIDLLGELLAAAGEGVRVALFNSCHSATQAEIACEHVEVAIGMHTTIRDDVAKTFAGQFYNSLGFGKSIADAFRQAVLQVRLKHGEGHDVPVLYAAEGIDPESVVLVNPVADIGGVAAAANEIADLNEDAARWIRDRDLELQIAWKQKVGELNTRGQLYSGAFLRTQAILKRQALHEYRDEMTRKRRRYRDLCASIVAPGDLPPLVLTDDALHILGEWRAPASHPSHGETTVAIEDPTSEALEPDLRRFEVEGDSCL